MAHDVGRAAIHADRGLAHRGLQVDPEGAGDLAAAPHDVSSQQVLRLGGPSGTCEEKWSAVDAAGRSTQLPEDTWDCQKTGAKGPGHRLLLSAALSALLWLVGRLR
jgi:hypothetical protein